MASPFRPFAGAILGAKSLEVADALADAQSVMELTGSARSPEIDTIKAVFSIRDEPSAAMGAMFCYAKALCLLAEWNTETDALRRALGVIGQYYTSAPASCTAIRDDARARGLWVPKTSPGSSSPHFGPAYQKPGDLILFNFLSEKDARGELIPEHVAIFHSWPEGANGQFFLGVEWGESGVIDAGSRMAGLGFYREHRTTAFVIGSVAIHAIK